MKTGRVHQERADRSVGQRGNRRSSRRLAGCRWSGAPAHTRQSGPSLCPLSLRCNRQNSPPHSRHFPPSTGRNRLWHAAQVNDRLTNSIVAHRAEVAHRTEAHPVIGVPNTVVGPSDQPELALNRMSPDEQRGCTGRVTAQPLLAASVLGVLDAAGAAIHPLPPVLCQMAPGAGQTRRPHETAGRLWS